ncbi:MAG: tetratricopeptide repeat protein, partial [Cyclobacteriaceae bacterium]|nr:tetratricopeptide repeat protein [Cyclobacteriaceae bacterium]
MRTAGIIFFIIFYELKMVNAQQSRIDSLTSSLTNTKGGERFRSLYDLAYEFIDVDNEKALLYAIEAKKLAFDRNDALGQTMAGRVGASALRRLERLNESILMGEEALQLAKTSKFNDEIKILLNSLAITYTYRADYDKALELYFQSLSIREETGNKAEISICLNNIGLVFFKMRSFEKALEYYDKSLRYKIDSKDQHDLDRLYINIGLCYNELKRFSEASEAIKQGLMTCDDKCSSQILIEAEYGLGHSLFGLKKYEASLTHF